MLLEAERRTHVERRDGSGAAVHVRSWHGIIEENRDGERSAEEAAISGVEICGEAESRETRVAGQSSQAPQQFRRGCLGA